MITPISYVLGSKNLRNTDVYIIKYIIGLEQRHHQIIKYQAFSKFICVRAITNTTSVTRGTGVAYVY